MTIHTPASAPPPFLRDAVHSVLVHTGTGPVRVPIDGLACPGCATPLHELQGPAGVIGDRHAVGGPDGNKPCAGGELISRWMFRLAVDPTYDEVPHVENPVARPRVAPVIRADRCGVCDAPIEQSGMGGSPRKWCSGRCKHQAARHRERAG